MIALNQTRKPPVWCPGLTSDMNLTRGLLRYHPIWKGVGQKVVDLGNGQHGTFGGSPVWAPGPARFGGPMLRFDGASDYLTFPDLALPANSASMFVVFRSNDVTAAQMLFSQGTTGTNFAIQIASSGVRGYWGTEGTGIRSTLIFPIVNDTWYHVAFTWDNVRNDARIYINGVLQQPIPSATGTSLGTGKYTTLFGTRLGAQFFDGDLIECGIYDRALSASDVAQSYRNSFELCRRMSSAVVTGGTILPHVMQLSS